MQTTQDTPLRIEMVSSIESIRVVELTLPCGIVSVYPVRHSIDKIAHTARTCYDRTKSLKTEKDNTRLFNYLVKHEHTSPLEFCELDFHITAPMFVIRQLYRHRTLKTSDDMTASINERSFRFTGAENTPFYTPPKFKEADEVNKQGSGGYLSLTSELDAQETMRHVYKEIIAGYLKLKQLGVSNEMARILLPQGLFSTFTAKMDFHNFTKFARLRLKFDVQDETRSIVSAMVRGLELQDNELSHAFNVYRLEEQDNHAWKIRIFNEEVRIRTPKEL